MILSAMITANLCVWGQTPAAIAFSLEKPTVTVGEPVLLRLDAKNSSSSPLVVDFGLNREQNILITIIDPAGKQHEKPEPSVKEGLKSFGWMRLGAGEGYSDTLILNEWFEFKSVGRYMINIRLKKAPMLDARVLTTEIPPLVLDVNPYDRQRLSSVCGELAAKIRNTNTNDDYLSSRLAARALGYVHDPVAVPYWDEVLEYADEMAISSLRKIANLDAVRVITRALDLHDKEARSHARFALQSIAHETSDPAVRAQAQLALRHP
jgi:hypothetical protein